MQVHIGKETEIVLDAKMVNVTKAFRKLSADQRQCELDENESAKDEVACQVNFKLKAASYMCNCTPWYIRSQDKFSKMTWLRPGCNLVGTICFRTKYFYVRAHSKQGELECKKSCIDTYYTSNKVQSQPLTRYEANREFAVSSNFRFSHVATINLI